jgi:hypothetical protein
VHGNLIKAGMAKLKISPKIFRAPDGRLDPDLIEKYMDALPEEKRKLFGPCVVKICDRELRSIDLVREQLVKRKAELEEVFSGLGSWIGRDLIMEKPQDSALHFLTDALLSQKAFFLGDRGFRPADFAAAVGEANCFLVEHDWAKAFEGATDFANGDFRLPYDVCAFEFQLTGVRVVALMTTVDEHVLMQIMFRKSGRWIVDDDINRHDNGSWSPYHAGRTAERNSLQYLAEFIGKQVRAISIALDAEVAEHDAVRVSERLVRAREKNGQAPPRPYHIVSLARRSRVAALPQTGTVEHGRVRLHFRRGHWRHFESHKTWIRWMLVGNPDLGFVDKQYRL